MTLRRAPLWTAARAAAADRYTIDALGMPSPVLMERASLLVTAVVGELLASRGGIGPVVVLVGPGNNGGDGLAVARLLRGRGVEVAAHLVTARRNEAAEQQRALAERHGVAVADGCPSDAVRPRLVVDAMLGTGARGAPRGTVAEAVAWLGARADLPVVAIDVPTGIDADTGARLGEAAVSADATVTFQCSKPGLHITPGRDHAGRVVVAEIGIVAPDEPAAAPPFVRRSAPCVVSTALERINPSAPQHKGQRGHVGLIAGGVNTPGAAVLAASGALRGGAGLVTARVASTDAARLILTARPEVMVEMADAPAPGERTRLDHDEADGPALLGRASALVVGPGLTDDAHGVDLDALWRRDPRPAVWDAGALGSLPVHASERGSLRVVTPHPGEAARLLTRLGERAWSSADVQAQRLDAALHLARALGAVCVLKGAGTLIAAPWGEVEVDGAGGPELATAGSGDVLAGLIGALLARIPTGGDDAFAFEVVAAAVWVHGVAGRLAIEARPGPAASDVAQAVDRALAQARTRADAGAPWAGIERREG